MPSVSAQTKFGETIKLVRIRRGLKQSDVAAKAGVSTSYLALIEKGKRRPGLELMERIADALRIPSIVLMFLSSDLSKLEKVDRDIAERLALLSWKLIEVEDEHDELSKNG